MKVLVLGGTGAMGVYLVNILADKGYEVFVTSRVSRNSIKENVHYLQGNAHEEVFRTKLLNERYQAIVDFLIYDEKLFSKIMHSYMSAAEQYIFLSSSRVYAECKNSIKEDSDRLLDVCKDIKYLQTNEYALRKAREEDALRNSGKNNWTIIRPYITYSNERLQLGVLEKEQWLYRALHGKSIVFSKDIAKRYTTLTYGYNVAEAIAGLLGNPKALGEAYHITDTKKIKWEEVLKLYRKILAEKLGKEVNIFWQETSDDLSKVCGNYHQIHYDRLYDRIFDSSKVNTVSTKVVYMNVFTGLEQCLREFIDNKHEFRGVSLKVEAYMDRVTGERSKWSDLPDWNGRWKYFVYRFTPYLKLKYGCKFNE